MYCIAISYDLEPNSDVFTIDNLYDFSQEEFDNNKDGLEHYDDGASHTLYKLNLQVLSNLMTTAIELEDETLMGTIDVLGTFLRFMESKGLEDEADAVERIQYAIDATGLHGDTVCGKVHQFINERTRNRADMNIDANQRGTSNLPQER